MMMGLFVDTSGVAGDSNFSSVVFLAGFEGADGATTYSEEKNGRAATFSGNAQLDTAQFRFGSSSLLMDGTGDSAIFADNVDWDLSDANSDQFTIETFVRWNAVASGNRGVISQWGSIGNRAWALELTSGDLTNLTFTFSTDGNATTNVATSSAGLTTATWYHLAVDKDSSGKIRVYVDGVMRGSSTPASSAFFNSINTLSIGGGTGTAGLMNGWIDETRITKGLARYASDGGFTAPTVAFPRS
jgi:hypothetical protein